MPARIITVSPDGTGDYLTVQEAVNSVPESNTTRKVIRISPGVYKQAVKICKGKNLITFAGLGLNPDDTRLTWNNTANKIAHHKDVGPTGVTTFECGSVIVEGEDCIAENLTFENFSPEGSGPAVAFMARSDRCAIYNCRFLGWMDTLCLHLGKHYLRDCYIEGSIDFIFGYSTALLEHCHIHCKAPGYITAHGRSSPQETTGYVFLRCVITGNGQASYAYLGRTWEAYARVVFAHSYMDACINPVGWDNWGNPENEKTASFNEHRCFGPGSNLSKRVPWTRELADKEAEQFIMHSFIDPDPQRQWLAQKLGIKIPYSAEQ